MKKTDAGFTLVEVLLVVVIIGAILAVVIPRAHRASVDAKYQLVRQNCSELASWADEWARAEIERQEDTYSFNLNNYYETLGNSGDVDWVADDSSASNWQGSTTDIDNDTTRTPDSTVMEIMPPNNMLKNPFTGATVFASGNEPTSRPVPGAIGCAYIAESSSAPVYNYFALVFQGTDCESTSDFYAGQDDGDIQGLRNGVFMAKLKDKD